MTAANRPRPGPHRRPREARGDGFSEGSTFHTEHNLVSAVLYHRDLAVVRDAGIQAEDFVDEEHLRAFEFILEHAAQYGQVPGVFALKANWPTYRVFRCQEPIEYYVERFLKMLRSDTLGRGVSEIAEFLIDRQVEAALQRHALMTQKLEVFNGKGNRAANVVWGHDLLDAEDQPIEWLVEGAWVAGSYGMLGGEEKSLKSYLVMSLCLAVASGEPWLGHFAVPRPRPVLALVGEGGQSMYGRRLKRMARTMGITSDDIERTLALDFQTRPLDRDAALQELNRQVKQMDAALVVIDPWYA